MKPIFTNALVNGTARSLSGDYADFASKVNRRLPDTVVNGRQTPTVSNFREIFSVTSKELAKTLSLNSSLTNITNYLSLVGRARETLQSIEGKLELLEDVINKSAGIIDADDYNASSVGAINTVDITGLAAAAETFENVVPSSTSGVGLGASFTIHADGAGSYNVTNIVSDGTGYAIGDKVTVPGNLLGGQTSKNNAVLEVTSISSLTEQLLLDELGNEIEFASDDIERQGLQLEAANLVTEVTKIINGSEFWDEEIFSGLRAVGYAQVGYQASETTLIDIQQLSSNELGTITEAGFLNTDFSILTDVEGTLVEEDTLASSGTTTSLYGWKIGLEQVSLGTFVTGSDAATGLITTTIGGATTPNDPTPTPQNTDSPAQVSRGDDYLASGGTFSYSISGSSLILTSDNLTLNGGDVAHGPYLISDNAVDLNAGDKVSFKWKGDVTDNAFDVYAYLLNSSTGAKVELLDEYGNSDTSFASVDNTIASDGSYYFVMVAGTFDYDFTGTITATESVTGTSTISGVTGASISGTARSGITSITSSGTSSGATTYSGVTQSTTSGSGSGASFNVTSDGSGNYTINSISASGSGYSVSDTITINGSSLGGTDSTHDLALSVAAISPSSFTGLTQLSTTGSGSGAVFSISTASDGSYTLNDISTLGSTYSIADTITVSGASLGGETTSNDATLTVSSVGTKTFSGVRQLSTSASGTGGAFQISIDGAGGHTINAVTSGGSSYEVGDTVTLSGADLGGVTTSNDLTFTISTIDATAGASIYISDVSITRLNESDDILAGIDLSTETKANAAAAVVAAALKQIKYRDSYLAGKELALTSSINEITVQRTGSNLLLPPSNTNLIEQSVRDIKRNEVISSILGQIHKADSLSKTGILKLM